MNWIGNLIFWGLATSLALSWGVLVVVVLCSLSPVFGETVIGAWR
jgi:hypothetical protein